MIGPQFVDSVARILSPGGQLFIQTDVQERAEGYLELVREHGAFTLEGPGGFIETNPFGARSNRERRAEEDGLPVWRLLGTRT
jgi:tRNA (guanine-N7-)-methyltransferase